MRVCLTRKRRKWTGVDIKGVKAVFSRQARARVLARIDRLADGNPGDVKSVGAGVLEMRIDYGPGYRVYYVMRGRELIVLLAGGDKDSQPRDIKTAVRLAQNL